jgi:hypothetical protein
MSDHLDHRREGAPRQESALEKQAGLSIGQKVERCNRLARQNWHNERAQLRQALPLPELMQQLGFGAHAQKSAFCPFHENIHTPSFSVWSTPDQGYRWKCHSGCGGGDELAFLKKARNLEFRDACKLWKDLAGGAVPPDPQGSVSSRLTSRASVPEHTPVQSSSLRRGNRKELEAVARLRGVSLDATRLMDTLGFLKFGTLWDVACWVLWDHSGRLAEARRLDGSTFSRGEKVRSLKNSKKSWPLGLVPSPQFGTLHPSAQILLTEGSGDFVAAFHFSRLNGPVKWQPVSILGKSPIHEEALPLFANKSVLIVPHVDADGGGLEAAKRWYAQLTSVGCRVQRIDLSVLTKRDNTPVKDLNDCVHLAARDLADLEEVFS